MDMMLGKLPITTPRTALKRFSGLIWGSAGCGKTTLAATAPGKILWLNFDPDGDASLKGFGDKILVADYSAQPDSCTKDFKDENTIPMKHIIKFLTENEDVKTVVVDSVTAFGDKALAYGVKDASSTAKGKSSTLEDPGFAGFGRKNTWTLAMIRTMLSVTNRLNRNVIFIGHENAPDKNQDGVVMQISIMLGSTLSESVPLQISEVWAMTDTGKKRTIAVRPVRLRKPMKTRMFKTDKGVEFEWKFNADTNEGDGIEDWMNAWHESGSKIDLPK